jgi:pimeloyl-ACP methyl ester carboxylesterase
MVALGVIVIVFCAGALLTFVGKRIIERAHPPQGRFVDCGGLRQHVMEMGRSAKAQNGLPPVVLLHGAGANLQDMQSALGERLAAHYRVILVDRPGFGFSARKSREASSPGFQATVLRDLLDRLGIDRPILIGHSWGGTMALTFALDFPQRVRGLVLVAPPTHPGLQRVAKANALLASPLGWLFAHTLALPLGALLLGAGCRAVFLPQSMPRAYVKRSAAALALRPPTLLANWADVGCLDSFLAGQVERYREMAVPTIVLTGDRDLIVPPLRHAMKFVAEVPLARLEVLPGFGHMVHHAAADRVTGAVEELAKRA